MKLNPKDRILGRTEPTPLTETEKSAFLSTTKYRVVTVNGNNPSIIGGDMLANLLPLSLKKEVMAGRTELEYAGIKIEKIIEEKPVLVEELPIEEESKKIVKKPIKKRVK